MHIHTHMHTFTYMHTHIYMHSQSSFMQPWRTKLHYFAGKLIEPGKNQPVSTACFQSCDINIKDIKIKCWLRKAIRIEKRETRCYERVMEGESHPYACLKMSE